VTLAGLLLGSLARGDGVDSLQVSFIDVGQGDSIWVHASDGTDVLIDGGRPGAGPTVVAHLQDGGIDDIDVMVLSHGHDDHIGGLIDVLRSAIPVECVIYNGQDTETDTYATLRAEMEDRSLTPTPAEIGQSYTWGAIEASVLNPQQVRIGDPNNDSVVLLIAYGQVDFLLTGDIEEPAEQAILDSGTPVAAEVLKVAHHGSSSSSGSAFLQAVGAEVAVVSVGDNSYGHPAQEVLERLRGLGAEVFRTDRDGTVVVTTDGDTYEVQADFLVLLPLAVRVGGPTATPTEEAGPCANGSRVHDRSAHLQARTLAPASVPTCQSPSSDRTQGSSTALRRRLSAVHSSQAIVSARAR
jgi:competence protein ComEC